MNVLKIIRWLVIVVIIAVILGLGFSLSQWLGSNGPKAEGVRVPESLVSVKYSKVHLEDFTVNLGTQGQVIPARSTVLSAEISGRIIDVSDHLEVGGLLEMGDLLVRVDSADYKAALSSALASVADAELLIEQEEVRAEQAVRDWSKLGRSGKPSDLVLRKPQLASAKARLSSAEASVIQAERNLARTEVTVPYGARVQKVISDLGTYVAPGAAIAEIVSSGEVEVRLPMSLEDYGYIDGEDLNIQLEASIGGEIYSWQSKMVRSEGQVNRQTMTTMIVARVIANNDSERFALPPDGLFVKASLEGRILKDVFVIPRLALQTGGEVFLVGEKDVLVRRKVRVVRTEGDYVIIAEGLLEGDKLIVSPLGAPVTGMPLNAVESRPLGGGQKKPETES